MQRPVQHRDELRMEAERLRHSPVVRSHEGAGGHGSLYEHNGEFDLFFSNAQIDRTAVCDDYANLMFPP